MRRCAATGLFLLLSCSAEELLFIPLPSHDATQSLILVLIPEGRPPLAHGFDPEEKRFPLLFEEGWPSTPNRLEVYALLFDGPLLSHGLPTGRLLLASSEAGRPLPAAERYQKIVWTPSEEGRWAAVSERPEVLDRLVVTGPNLPDLCVSLAREFDAFVPPRLAPALVDYRPYDAVLLDDERAFVTLAEGHFVEVRRDRVTQLSTPTITPYLAGFLHEESAEVWLYGPRGRLARGHPDTGFVEESVSPRNQRAFGAEIVGSEPGSPFELFIVTRNRTLERYLNGAWELLYQLDGQEPSEVAGVVWVAPNEVMAVGLIEWAVVHSRAGDVTIEPLIDSLGSDLLRDISIHPTLGPIVVSDAGVLFHYDGEAWRNLGWKPERAIGADVIAPIDQGVFFGGSKGTFHQFFPEEGLCHSARYSAGSVRRIRTHERGYFLLAKLANMSEAVFAFLDYR